MVTEYGMSDSIGPIFLGGQEEVFIAKDWGHTRNYSESLAARVDDEVRHILDTQYERAKAAISADLGALDRVSAALNEYERMSGEEFEAIYRGKAASEVLKHAAPEVKDEPEPEEAAAEDTEAAAEEAEPQTAEPESGNE